MAPFFHLLLLLLSSISITTSSFDLPNEKKTHLHFFFHEIISGPNQTAFIVAGPDKTSDTFGDIVVFDNALREGPETNSKLIGRAQGMSIRSSMEDRAVLTPINFVFTEASEYNGSTLTILGRVPAAGAAERKVVGGSGRFRMARGYAISNVVEESTVSFVIEFDFFVTQY